MLPAASNFDEIAKPSFRTDLQGLRGIAILLVVLGHAGVTLLAGGFVGVDIFFVLSGYLITGLLLREYEQEGRIVLIRFYARRLKRLLPALAVMLGGASIATVWLLSNIEAQTQLASAPFAAAWASNIYLTFAEFGYFDELVTRDIFLHTWSLGVEEQFYLIWPLMLLAFMPVARRSFSDKGSAGLAFFGLVFVSSLAVSLYWTSTAPHAAFYLMPSRIWQFALGAIVYLLLEGQQSGEAGAKPYFSLRRFPSSILLKIGLLLIVVSAVGLDANLAYPGFWALAPSFGAALIIMAGHLTPENRRSPLAHPALVWIGDRSYSWYLWHWPALIIGFSLGFEGHALPTLALVLLSLLAAILSYRLIELPFWKGRFSQAEPICILLWSLLVMALTIAAMFHNIRSLPKSDITLEAVSKSTADLPLIYAMGCDAWYKHARIEPCMFGEDEAMKTVVLLGDSIGAQWFSMVPVIFPKPDWRVIVLTKSACPMIDEDYFYPRIKQIYQVCTDWRNRALEIIEKGKPDVVILGSAAEYRFSDTQWINGTARILERLSKAATKIFVIPGTPSLGFDGPSCLARHLSPEGIIPRDACVATERTQLTKSVALHLKKAARYFPNVQILDLTDIVCPDEVCNAIRHDGLVVFRDSKHLTDSFVRAQTPVIRERINRALANSEP